MRAAPDKVCTGFAVLQRSVKLLCLAIALCGTALFADAAPEARNDAKTNGVVLWDGNFHQRLYEMDPLSPVQQPRADRTPEQQRLEQLDETEEGDLSGLSFNLSRISILPADPGVSGDEAATRAERALIRNRAKAADRLVRRGNIDEAVALMLNTETLLKTPTLRAAALNRVAAFYFRSQEYKKAAEYMRQAWDLSPGDVATACNLSAVLLSLGEVDEALELLLQVYGRVFDQPKLAFSVHFNLACIYSVKGEKTKALQNLLIAARADPPAAFTAIGDPNLDPIREEPAFKHLYSTLAALMQPPPRSGQP